MKVNREDHWKPSSPAHKDEVVYSFPYSLAALIHALMGLIFLNFF